MGITQYGAEKRENVAHKTNPKNKKKEKKKKVQIEKITQKTHLNKNYVNAAEMGNIQKGIQNLKG